MIYPSVLIIGLDGATFDLIKPWAAAGKLPTLARLMQRDAIGPLESTLPPVTSPAWPTFMTGKNPGKHGVFDFIRPSAGTFEMVNASQIDGKLLWELLSEAGYSVGVQFMFFGLIAEMLTRTYHESQGKSIYVIREIVGRDAIHEPSHERVGEPANPPHDPLTT